MTDQRFEMAKQIAAHILELSQNNNIPPSILLEAVQIVIAILFRMRVHTDEDARKDTVSFHKACIQQIESQDPGHVHWTMPN